MILAIIVFVLILSLLIFVHELGHFICAKVSGVKVEEFCIGFPPRIWQKKKGETLYSIGLIPFGGFNKIYGEINDQNREDPKNFASRPVSTRALITVGGVAMNILLAVIIFYFLLSLSGFQTEVGLISDYQFPFGHQENFITENGIKIAKISYPTLIEKTSSGFLHSFNIMHYSFFGLAYVVELSFQEKDITPLKSSVAGPVGILGLIQPVVEAGLVPIFALLAIISLALALFNILPIPGLDGGKLVFLAIEAVVRKPIPQKIEEQVTTFFFGLLILLMILVTINDIQRFF